MNPTQVQQEIGHYLSKVAAIPMAEIDLEASLNHLGVDSVAIISLAAFLEERYGVMAEPSDLAGEISVAEVTTFVLQKSKGHDDVRAC